MGLALLAEERGQLRQALEWTVKSVALFSEFPHPATGPAPGHLARLVGQLGTGALEQCWQHVTGSPLPLAVRSYVNYPRNMDDGGRSAMTDDPVTAAARAAAMHLSAQYGPGLAAEVESALHARGTEHRPEQYFDPVSMGSLIVSIASLAWTIYTGLKQKTPRPPLEVLARAVRVELRTRGENALASQDKIIDVVVTQIIQATDDSG